MNVSMKKISFFLPLLLLLPLSCARENDIETAPAETTQQKDSLDSEITKELPLDNEYTQVALSLCDDTGRFVYTESNTICFDLSVNQGSDCFVFASELYCGHAGGSCGYSIDVYQKGDTGYTVPFSGCGFNPAPLRFSKDGILSFTYEVRSGYTMQVNWNGKEFEEEIIAVNGLNYIHMDQISKITGNDITSYISNDPESRDNVAHRVNIERLHFGENCYGELYEVNSHGSERDFFLFNEDVLVLHKKDILSIEAHEQKHNGYRDLEIISSDDYVMTEDTSYYVPRIYVFSNQTKQYEKSK
jgi:hypothetical protein